MEGIEISAATTVIFAVLVVFGIGLDLYYHKSDKDISIKDAALWSLFWVALACLFGGYLFTLYGSEVSSLFFAGYVLEKTLSVDNLFLFTAIFSWFSIPTQLRHRILYWGIIGAIVFRLIFVLIGTSLMSLSGFVEIIFGLIVGYTAWLMLKSDDDDGEKIEDYSNHFAYKLVHKFFPVSSTLHGHNFFVRKNIENPTIVYRDESEIEDKWYYKNIIKRSSILYATPLFLCLVIVEISDVMFAFDSVPAVIAVTRDPYIIYFAMIFAILGLRTMYFLLEAMKKYFIYLEKAVIMILFFIAGKLILNATYTMYGIGLHVHHMVSLGIILTLLFGSVLLSVFQNRKLAKG